MEKDAGHDAYIREHSPPPAYDSNFQESSHHRLSDEVQATGFRPTTQLTIETAGHDYNTWSFTGDMAIPVFRIPTDAPASAPTSQFANQATKPAYLSLRIKKNSNSAALVRGDDPGTRPILSTVYRWGPGRDPRMRIYPASGSGVTVEQAVDKDSTVPQGGSEFMVNTHWISSRSADMDTPYGKFEWRYGKRAERKANDAAKADSLLVLEKVMGDSSKAPRVRVAQLVRNAEFRTAGTSKWAGGNGGRLMIDLSPWMNGGNMSSEKGGNVAEEIEAFVVCGALCMLKRETDRAKDNQLAAIS